MNKTVKILVSILLAAVILAGGTIGVLYFGFGIDVFDQSGWNTTKEGVTQYLDYYGDPLTQWQLIEDDWYYFDPGDGGMVTGWLEESGSRYYLDENGVRQTGWLRLEDGTYYIDTSSGATLSGWLELDGQRYYLDEEGCIVTGWLDQGVDRYHLDPDTGAMTVGWVQEGDDRYFMNEDGTLYYGWLESSEGRFYLDETTGAMVTGWLDTDNGRCYLGEDGHPVTGWVDVGENRYYLDEEGYTVSGWLDIDDTRYYLNDDGSMVTGWLETEDATYYFHEDGTIAKGKVIIDDLANYFTSTGAHIMLVNHWNEVPEDYKPDLVVYDGWSMDRSVYYPLINMLSNCPHYYKITSAYRSEATQQYIWDKRLKQYQDSGYSYSGALAQVEAYVAVPGTSEHHLGLAIDISGSDAGCQWLAEHCWEYGFILRYPEGKEDITGIYYERWHFRYVGTELALELRDLGVCLEEYMDMLTEAEGSDAGTSSNPDNYTRTTAESEE